MDVCAIITKAAHNAITTSPVVVCSTLAYKINKQGNNRTVDRLKENAHPGLIHSS